MINLIKNELYKIFHKKGIYIVLLITLLYTILTNYLYSTTSSYNSIDEGYENELYYLELLEELGETQTEEYLESNIYIYNYKFAKSFGDDSWQRVILTNDVDYSYELYEITYQIVSYELDMSDDLDVYLIAKNELENLRSRFANMTEEEYITNQIKTLKETLESTESNSDLYYLYQSELLALELRLTNDVSYAFDTLNEYLDAYKYSQEKILAYQNKDFLKEDEEYYYNSAKEEAAVAKANIENKIDEKKADAQYQIVISFYDEYFIMILVMTVLVAGSIVSEEFSKGTIKLLLVKPYTRTKILFSKFLTVLIMILFAIITPLIMQLIVGSIYNGFNGLTTPVIVYNYETGLTEVLNLFKYFGLMTISVLPKLIIIATVAFTLSTLFISTSIANTLTIVAVFGSSLINAFAEFYEIDILKYFITLNWDWSYYLFGGSSPYKGVAFSFSVVISLIYFIVMLLITTIVFKKKNIKNI